MKAKKNLVKAGKNMQMYILFKRTNFDIGKITLLVHFQFGSGQFQTVHFQTGLDPVWIQSSQLSICLYVNWI